MAAPRGPLVRAPQAGRPAGRHQGEAVYTRKNAALIFSMLLGSIAATCPVAHATIVGVSLGTGAPQTVVGIYRVTPFDQVAQANIPELSGVPAISPTPIGGALTFTPDALKATVGSTWTSWSHGYTGPVFAFVGSVAGTSASMTLPSGATAFSFWYEGGANSSSQVTVTSVKGGTVVGPITVSASGGAKGIGYYSTDPTDFITSIQVDSDDANFALAEFNIGQPSGLLVSNSVPTLSPWPLAALAVLTGLAGVAFARQRFRQG